MQTSLRVPALMNIATFACFLTPVYDFIRMAAMGKVNVKMVGSRAGVSIGEEGPSQAVTVVAAGMR